jgi:hypothetical protein
MKNLFVAIWLCVLSSSIWSAVSSTEATRLGSELTPVGAEVHGNGRDIPDWQGNFLQSRSVKIAEGQNPFANDNVLYRIDSQNMASHLDRLTDGQKEMLKKYSDYYLNIYPSHRISTYPDFVFDAIKSNAVHARLLPLGSGVSGAVTGTPFPIPGDALEVLFNHILRYRESSLEFTSLSSLIDENGRRSDTVRKYRYYLHYSKPGLHPENLKNELFFMFWTVLSPAEVSGTRVLLHEPMDRIVTPRKAWIFLPGDNRARRAPNLAYDELDPNSGMLRTVDQMDMFNGMPDRYEWSLLGKKEIYIPYNAYALADSSLKVDDLLKKEHVNSRLLRYEPHRVWVVEAKLRTGMKHRYERRRFYLDEDSWTIVYAEMYDKNDHLWQMSESHLVSAPDASFMRTALEVTYDFKSGRYFVDGLKAERTEENIKFTEDDFSVSSVGNK